jgi:hypothetical protein
MGKCPTSNIEVMADFSVMDGRYARNLTSQVVYRDNANGPCAMVPQKLGHCEEYRAECDIQMILVELSVRSGRPSSHPLSHKASGLEQIPIDSRDPRSSTPPVVGGRATVSSRCGERSESVVAPVV